VGKTTTNQGGVPMRTFIVSEIMKMGDPELLAIARNDLEIPGAVMIGTTELRELVLKWLKSANRIKAEDSITPEKESETRQIINGIPRAIALAKRKNLPLICVMEVEDECIPVIPGRWPSVNEIKLKGITKQVFDHCKNNGLKPIIRRTQNGNSFDYEVVIPTPP